MLNVIYSSSMADSGTLSYLAAIEKKIYTRVCDIDGMSIIDLEGLFQFLKNEQILALRPLKDYQEELIELYLGANKKTDVEGIMQYKELTTTITAEAISRELKNVAGKKILIINRSEIMGIPLMIELVKRNATVTIAHSKSSNIKELILNTDILITATSNDNFKIPANYLDEIETIIDLSEDTDSKRAIRRIKTVDILKERVQE